MVVLKLVWDLIDEVVNYGMFAKSVSVEDMTLILIARPIGACSTERDATLASTHGASLEIDASDAKLGAS